MPVIRGRAALALTVAALAVAAMPSSASATGVVAACAGATCATPFAGGVPVPDATPIVQVLRIPDGLCIGRPPIPIGLITLCQTAQQGGGTRRINVISFRLMPNQPGADIALSSEDAALAECNYNAHAYTVRAMGMLVGGVGAANFTC